ncbi:DnaD domain-containing protein [Staphylococcus simulans]|uniref:DnaD domain-containing protein n=1 Tax=Staphylococcus simulans TaxID=1286 RepID=UPI000D1F73C1|nr:DnaD domain protein [Staphylococcus simulans]PTI96343.1 DNA replication protein DnaD [Staphylococcus simulans]RIN49990.1 DnaD domain protein [Staphylococcus simulans]RIN56296.1 DnaD domain protein [Staphylococcus simulans]RIN66061.1 DnaD domain protein [Staphylococcus simulans]
MSGWISLHRSVENHWLYQEDRVFSKFEAWLHLLLEANHKDNKVTIGNQLVEVKRGQKLTSVLTLSDLWGWSRTKTNSFLELLKKDNMIDIKKTTKYTLITIVNYDFYQSDEGRKKHQIEQQKDIKKTSTEHQKDIKKTSTEHQKDTNNNVNKDNNVNNEKKEKKINAFDFFQENGFGVLNQYTAEDMNHYIESFDNNSDEIVQAALKIALDRNKTSWGYAKSILNNWLKANLKSMEEIKAYEQQQIAQRTNNRNYYISNAKSKEITPEWLLNREHENKNKISDKQQDKDFEKDRAAFLKHIQESWGGD